MTIEAMRAAFDARWLLRQRKTFPPNYYESYLKNWDASYKGAAWEAWQAAVEAEQERNKKLIREFWEEIRKGETP